MSTKIRSQIETALMDKIEKGKAKLSKLQQKQKLEIGSLACKHGFHQFDIKQLAHVLAKIAKQLNYDHS